jgi:hypothetical protein
MPSFVEGRRWMAFVSKADMLKKGMAPRKTIIEGMKTNFIPFSPQAESETDSVRVDDLSDNGDMSMKR